MQQEIWFQKYHILHLLGSGGTARVYLAKHIKLNSYRAIKCISKNHPLYNLQINEALILKNLKHSCIPIIYDIEEDEEGSYIVEQYLEGDTLKDQVLSMGQFREDIAINYAIQLCDLIHYLHTEERPILYVDLKPENILVADSHLKLIDFGSAVYRDDDSKEQTLTATRGYAAPELYKTGRPDERCDIYGIGMLLYYMTTGIRISPNAKHIANIEQAGTCSEELKHIINRCLKFNPSQRYATVDRLKKQLSALMQKSEAHQEASQRLTIAVAGTQTRIGVTHLSFRLCNYMKSLGINCQYREENQSEGILRMKKYLESASEGAEALLLEGISVSCGNCDPTAKLVQYPVTLIDYGSLTRDNLEYFLKADIKLIILGTKLWELEYAEKVLEMIAEYKDITYLFNFLDGKQFQEVVRNMENRRCYRIPYEPDPFGKITEYNGQKLFDELIGERYNPKQKAGRLRLRRKGWGKKQ